MEPEARKGYFCSNRERDFIKRRNERQMNKNDVVGAPLFFSDSDSEEQPLEKRLKKVEKRLKKVEKIHLYFSNSSQTKGTIESPPY